jgi:hypothetical protein
VDDISPAFSQLVAGDQLTCINSTGRGTSESSSWFPLGFAHAPFPFVDFILYLSFAESYEFWQISEPEDSNGTLNIAGKPKDAFLKSHTLVLIQLYFSCALSSFYFVFWSFFCPRLTSFLGHQYARA